MEKIAIRDLEIWFGQTLAIKDLSLEVREHEILGVIGPAKSGKTSFLRTINRMNDLNPFYKMSGEVSLSGENIYDLEPETLRRRVGMVFALPIPLPTTIMKNLTYGPQLQWIRNRSRLEEIAERSLKRAYLWDEVKDKLHTPALSLSGGQQQRLCIARTLALEPEVVLYDEPCSGLDPVSTAKVEEAMVELKKECTIILVTNNVMQAARVADRTAFFLMGELVEIGETKAIFTAPIDKRTNDYVSGRFG